MYVLVLFSAVPRLPYGTVQLICSRVNITYLLNEVLGCSSNTCLRPRRCPQVSQARLGEDEEEEVTPPPPPTGAQRLAAGTAGAAASAAATAAAASRGGGPAGAAGGGRPGGGGGGGGDGFTLTDAPQEMDVNLEYKELAREGEGDDADPDVMMGTQPGGTLKNVAFRVKNRYGGYTSSSMVEFCQFGTRYQGWFFVFRPQDGGEVGKLRRL